MTDKKEKKYEEDVSNVGSRMYDMFDDGVRRQFGFQRNFRGHGQ